MNLAPQPVQRAVHGRHVPARDHARGAAPVFGGGMGSTWVFDGPRAKSIGLDRGDSAP